jgi:hypothetical protein
MAENRNKKSQRHDEGGYNPAVPDKRTKKSQVGPMPTSSRNENRPNDEDKRAEVRKQVSPKSQRRERE